MGIEETLAELEAKDPEMARRLRDDISSEVSCARLSEKMLARDRSLESLVRFAGGIAHHFNNILTAVIGYAELLKDDLSDPDVRAKDGILQDISQVISICQKMEGLVSKIHVYTQKSMYRKSEIFVHPLIYQVVGSMRDSMAGIEIVEDFCSSDPVVVGDPSMLSNALGYLFLNSRDAMPKGGRLTISTAIERVDGPAAERYDLSPGGYLKISVVDTGVGIEEEFKGYLFEPFFTTKEFALHIGMDLAAVYGIVKSHNGSIMVESEKGRGAAFRIYLPVTPEVSGSKHRRRIL